MMSGRPVLYTKSIGLDETVKKAQCGFAFENFNEFEEQLIRLYTDKQLRITMGQRSRAFAEKNMVYSESAKKLLEEIRLRFIKTCRQNHY
jgi:glycosyltransferase involved in cell wall biosynthesis